MDQGASNKDADDQSPPIPHQSPIEKPEGADATMDRVTTPEAEMNIGLLPPLRTQTTDNTPRKKIRMEIPDSEGASEVSSPVKVAKDHEKRDEAAEHDGRVQTVQEATEQEVGQEDTPMGKQKATRTEIPDREEASEFSSPVKVGIGDGASHDGAVQVDGGLEIPGEVQQQHVEEEDTTMMDVSGPVQEEGMAEVSRAAEGAGVDVAKKSVIGTTESAEATKEMVYTTERDDGLPSTLDKDDDVGQGILQGGVQDAQSASSPDLDTTKNLDQGTLSAAVNGGVVSPRTTPVKGVAGAMETPVNPNAQGSLVSPGTVAKEIAIAARKLLVDEISPTILDTSDTAEKPKLLNTIRAIPDSDDGEDDELPDAPSMQEHITRVPASSPSPARETPPTITKPTVTEEKLPKAVETSAPGPKLGTAQQGQEKEVVASASSCKGKSLEPEGPASAETTSSPAERFNFKAPALHRPTPSVNMRSRSVLDEFSTDAFPLGTEDQLSPQPLSSPSAAQLHNEPTIKSPEQATVPIMEESSQATDIASSPLKPLQGGSVKAKRKESPTGSSTAPEAPQSKDVLMAELKTIKIASIQSRISALETEISTKRRKLEEVTKDLKQPPAETVKRHIKLLHDYNDIRDVGQGLVGMIADNRGVRIGELYEEFGIGLKD